MNVAHDANRAIYTVPSVARGLLTWGSYLADARALLEPGFHPAFDELVAAKAVPIMQSSDQYRVVDRDKSLVLDMMFGETYHEALEIASNGLVEVVVWSKQQVVGAPWELYFQTKSLLRVYEPKRGRRSQFPHQGEALARVGLHIRDKSLVPIVLAQSHEQIARAKQYTVDLRQWYCSCDAHSEAYTNNKVTLLENELLGFLHGRQLERLPVCSHLLAALIAYYNQDTCNVALAVTDNVYEFLMA